MVIKNKSDFTKIVQENPFGEHYFYDRIHIILFQNAIQSLPLEKLDSDYGEEEICIGNHCLYLYLPRTAKRKKLNTNYLEKLFNVDLTMRKLNVVEKIIKQVILEFRKNRKNTPPILFCLSLDIMSNDI